LTDLRISTLLRGLQIGSRFAFCPDDTMLMLELEHEVLMKSSTIVEADAFPCTVNISVNATGGFVLRLGK